MMADNVLAIFRKTMLHENTVENLSFKLATGEIVLDLLQPMTAGPIPNTS